MAEPYKMSLKEVKYKIIYDNSLFDIEIGNRISFIGNVFHIINILCVLAIIVNGIIGGYAIVSDREIFKNKEYIFYLILIIVAAIIIIKEIIFRSVLKRIDNFSKYYKLNIIVQSSLMYYSNYNNLSQEKIQEIIDTELIYLVGLKPKDND